MKFIRNLFLDGLALLITLLIFFLIAGFAFFPNQLYICTAYLLHEDQCANSEVFCISKAHIEEKLKLGTHRNEVEKFFESLGEQYSFVTRADRQGIPPYQWSADSAIGYYVVQLRHVSDYSNIPFNTKLIVLVEIDDQDRVSKVHYQIAQTHL